MARRFIILVLLLLGCVDALGSIDLGTRFSGQGLLTILYAIAAWGLVLGSGKISKAGLKTVWPFIALVVWALTTMFWYTPSVSGTQNVLCLASFIGLALLATGLAQTWELQGSIQMFFRYGIWCAAAAYGWCLLNSSLSTSEIIGPRSFGIAALFGVAWYASKWRFGKHGAFVLAAILLVEIGASLSRGALVASLVMLTLGRVSATVKGWLWGLLSLGVAMVAFWWMFNNIEPLRDHFLLGDVQWHVGDVGINVSGRSSLWRVTYDSFLDSPWVGKGAGSAAHLVRDRFRTIGHPHNDYLRVLHDYGIVGFSLWLLGWFRILKQLWKQARFSERWGKPDAQLQFATFLAVLGTCLVMVTDNPMTYIFVMAPLGVLVGAAAGAASADRYARALESVPVQPLARALPGRWTPTTGATGGA
ncbi:MAG TPA: O-antigen ligase family protein [Bryobacteraceae bacterium]|nr:O-antigen ligase family protein [Bryobacteraceae bacterium]